MKTKNALTDAQRQEVTAAVLADPTINLIALADHYGVAFNEVVLLAKPLIKRRHPNAILLSNEDEFVRLYRDERWSMPKIAERFGVSSGCVANALERRGIEARDASEAHRIYAMREDFFDVIDTEEKAYIMGFIWADGCNQMEHYWTIAIDLAEYDRELLLKFARIVFTNPDDVEGRVKTNERTKDDGRVEKSVKLNLNSKHMCLTLQRHGCVTRKSLILTYPQASVPKHLNRHFIRGYFDGDGTIYWATEKVSGCGMVGTLEMLQSIQAILLPLGIDVSISKCDKTNAKNTYCLNVSGNQNQQRFLSWIYSGTTLYLDRKHERHLQFREKIAEIDRLTRAGTRGYPKHYMDRKYHDFYQPITINGTSLDITTVANMTRAERSAMVPDIFEWFRANGFHFQTSRNLLGGYETLVGKEFDTTVMNAMGHGCCTQLCKYYSQDFFRAHTRGRRSFIEAFNDDALLRRLIENRLLLNWNPSKPTENQFNISYQSIVASANSSGVAPNVSFFQPSVAKLIYLKYSNEGDVVFDFSAGWGARMLGAASCGRRYIGIDPHTTPSLTNLALDLKLEGVELRRECSEDTILNENSVDFAFSSPPYYDTEVYSDDASQAYSRGEEYFYGTYWTRTLATIKRGLKPGKLFALNIAKCPRMVEMSRETFGPEVEVFQMQIGRLHFHADRGPNSEPIYVFRNDK